MINLGKPIHSYYRLDRFEAPYYSWLHPQHGEPRTKIYAANHNRKFSLMDLGLNLPSTFDSTLTLCTKLVSDIKNERLRPEYIAMPQWYDCEDGYELCKIGIQSIIGPDKQHPMYHVEKIFGGDWHFKNGRIE
jgi:hypothetical protein